MKSKRRHEGYLLIDHSEGPGLSDAVMRLNNPDAPSGAGRTKYEAPILICTHCGKGLVLNPLRTRERPWCAACDAYICDECKLALVLTGVCKPFNKLADEVQERAEKGHAIPIFERIPSHG